MELSKQHKELQLSSQPGTLVQGTERDNKNKRLRYCSVLNCNSNSDCNPDLSFFKLPRIQSRASRWLEEIRIKNIPRKLILVCEKHFKPKYFIQGHKFRKRISPHAVPTMHLDHAENLESPPDAIRLFVDPWLDQEQPTINRISAARAQRKIYKFVEKSKRCPGRAPRNIAEIIRLHEQYRPAQAGYKFTDEFKFFALKLYYLSPNTYKVMQPVLNFPKISTLYRLCIPSSTYISEHLMLALKIKADAFTSAQRECAVCFGALDIKAKLHYDVKKDEIIGFHDVDGTQRPVPAEKALVVMVRGIYDNWKQAVSFSFLADHQDYGDVRIYILKILEKIFSIGLSVRVLISDMKTDFIGLAKEKRINTKDPYFYVNGKKVYYMYDIANLITSLREAFISSNVSFNGMVASWEHIAALYDHEFEKPLKLAPKLTRNHIVPYELQHSEKDKLLLAAQVFSETTASALSTYAELKVIAEPVAGTVHWILLIHKLLTMLNFTSFNSTDETFTNLTGEKDQLTFINDVLTILKTVRLTHVRSGSDDAYSDTFLSRLKSTLRVIISLYDDIYQLYNKFPRRLSLDCLYSFFDTVREKYGQLPTCNQIQDSMSKIPIFNVFQRFSNRKNTDNLDNFLKNALTFGDGIVMHEPTSARAEHNSNACFESTSSVLVDINSAEVSRENPVQHLAAYLLYEGYQQHSECDAMKCYAFENSHSTPVILKVKSNGSHDLLYQLDTYQTVMVMVPTEFVEFIESMEITLKLYFETEYQRNTLMGLKEHILSENVTFATPCKCFPLEYVKCLYIRYRLNLLLLRNNKHYDDTEQCRKYFSLNL